MNATTIKPKVNISVSETCEKDRIQGILQSQIFTTERTFDALADILKKINERSLRGGAEQIKKLEVKYTEAGETFKEFLETGRFRDYEI